MDEIFDIAFTLVSDTQCNRLDPHESDTIKGLRSYFKICFDMCEEDPEMGYDRFWESFANTVEDDTIKADMDNLQEEVVRCLRIATVLKKKLTVTQ